VVTVSPGPGAAPGALADQRPSGSWTRASQRRLFMSFSAQGTTWSGSGAGRSRAKTIRNGARTVVRRRAPSGPTCAPARNDVATARSASRHVPSRRWTRTSPRR